jgi:hypothetical protein
VNESRPGASLSSRKASQLGRADAFDRVSNQTADEAKETDHVRELGVRIEGGFVLPFGMDVKHEGRANRLEKMDADVAGLGAGWSEEEQQLVAEVLLLSCNRLDTYTPL